MPPPKPPTRPTSPLSEATPQRLSVTDIADLAGVKPAAVSNWARRHDDFPRPLPSIEGEDARKVHYARDEVLARIYPTLPKVSIDYGVMEPAGHDPAFTVCTLPMELSWLDVGSWSSYAETVALDDEGNRCNGHWCDKDSRNMLIISDDPTHVIATIGCRDLVIVHTKDATLVCPRDATERVKEIAEQVPHAWR